MVTDLKLKGYLLSPTHLVGKDKARVFASWGFDLTNWEYLRYELLKLVRLRKVVSTENLPSYTKFYVHGKIRIPRGGTRSVRTIWAIDQDKHKPHLVSAFPL